MSSLYSAQLPDAAGESLAVAVQGSAAVAEAAREAFVHAMSRASIVVALVAALGALIAWRHLPARSIGSSGTERPRVAVNA
jgi:hypothetical protein